MQFIIIFAAGIVTLILLITGELNRRRLLYLGLFSIVFGQRGIFIGKSTNIVPLEAIIFILFIFLITFAVITRGNENIQLPVYLVIMSSWCIFRAILSLIQGASVDPILTWTLPLILGIPTFVVIRHQIKTINQLEITISILLLVSVIMSLLAIIEYQLPSVAKLLPGIFTKSYIINPDGFVRAAFSFWGYPAAAIVITWGVLIAYQRIINPTQHKRWFLYLIIILVGCTAVYISGQRSSWIGLALAIILLSLPGKLKGWIGTALVGISTFFFPAVFWRRFDTITTFIETGIPVDGSTISRLTRMKWGVDQIFDNPLIGGGYGHWLTHNAFLEIGSTVGIIASIAFLIFFVQLIIRICREAFNGLQSTERQYGWLFLSLAVTWVIQINVETIFQTPALAVAFWPYMALAWYLPDLLRESNHKNNTQTSVRVT